MNKRKKIEGLSKSESKILAKLLKKLGRTKGVQSRKTSNPSKKLNKNSISGPSKKDGKIKIENLTPLSTILSCFFKEITFEKISKDLKASISLFNHKIEERGITEGTKRYKVERQYMCKKLLGIAVECPTALSVDRTGWPNKYRYFKSTFIEFQLSEQQACKYLGTLMSVGRLVCSCDPPKRFPSITRPIKRTSEYMKEISEYKEALPQIFKDLGIQVNRDPETLGKSYELHLSTKQGPNPIATINGRKLRMNATVSAHVDALAVISDREVYKNVISLSKHLGIHQEFSDNLDAMSVMKSSSDWVKDPVCSRIAVLEQPENKARIVAIIDYWSQSLLKPIHDELASVSLKVPTSYVEDQDAGRELCREFTIDGDPVSADATDFTDRFPREIQETMLSVLYNESFAKSVIRLMACRNFKIPNGRTVRYSAGQPMGAYASFPMANLAHATYVAWKLRAFGQGPKDAAVVGDDVCFKNNNEAWKSYIVGMGHLGVPFNTFKGFESTQDIKIAEFCKRLYVNGNDYSAISPRILRKSSKDFKYLPLLDQYLDTGTMISILESDLHSSHKDFVEKLFLLPTEITGIKNNLYNAMSHVHTDGAKQFISKLDDISQAHVSVNEFLGTCYVRALLEYSKISHVNLLQQTGVLSPGSETKKKMTGMSQKSNPAPGASGESVESVISLSKNKLNKQVNLLPRSHPIKVGIAKKILDDAKSNIKVRIGGHKLQNLPSLVTFAQLDPLASQNAANDVATGKKFIRTTFGDPRSVLSDESREEWVQALFAISVAVIKAVENCEVFDRFITSKFYILPKTVNREITVDIESPVPELSEKPTNWLFDLKGRETQN